MPSKLRGLCYIILSCPLNCMKLAHPMNKKIGIRGVSMCTWHTFQSHIILIYLVLQVRFPRSRRWDGDWYAGRLLGSAVGANTWRGGEGREQNRKREKLGCRTATIRAATDPQGGLKPGWPCRVIPRFLNFCFVLFCWLTKLSLLVSYCLTEHQGWSLHKNMVFEKINT